MSKKVKYLVAGTVVDTVKEVNEILGADVKATKKAIENGEIEGVEIVDENDEQASTLEDDPTNMEDSVLEDKIKNILAEDDNTEENITEEDNVEEDNTTGEDNENDATEDNIDVNEDSSNDESDTPIDAEDNNEDDSTNEDDTSDNENDNSNKDAVSNSVDDLSPEIREKLAKITKKPGDKGSKKSKIQIDIEKDGYPEVGTFKDIKDLKKFYKQITNEQLDEWLELEGLTDKVKLCDNEGINRMRKCMALSNLHFPRKSTKKKSKYSQYKDEDLIKMCFDNDIEVRDAKGDTRILRMYAIMALREAKLLD